MALSPRKIAGYGWRKDLPDFRDHLWENTLEGKAAAASLIAPAIDLEALMPPVYDQGQLGSCTANGVAGALEFEEMQQGEGSNTPSRLFIYYEERKIEGTVSWDSGAEVRDGLKVVANLGAPPETDWPYNISRFTAKPPSIAYQDATAHKAISYSRLYPNGGLRKSLTAGKPVVFGFTVYESFESQEVADSGMVPMPSPGESVVGGHCVLAVGYNSAKRLFKCRNSWGTDWGLNGYFWMPFGYFTYPETLATDFWNIKLVT